MDYLDTLCAFIESVRPEALGDSAREAARTVLLDTIGAMLGGSRLPENAALARFAAERSRQAPATLFGHAGGADPLFATLANATAGVSLEVDEGNRWGGGHPAIHVVPPALAVGEDLHADGRRVLAAIVAGYEVASRMGGATRLRPNVHAHGTWGTLGAAVAVATLHGHGRRGLREIVNLAASMSPANTWTPCFEGGTIRNLYPGRATMQGILAVHLHGMGYTGVADGPADVYGTILAEAFEPAKVVEGLGERYRIERNYFKFHACCLYNHPALDALAALRERERFAAGDVERIAVTSLPFAERMTIRAPANMLAAKFSIPYAVAASLVRGRTDVEAFRESVVRDPEVLALAARVEVRGDPGIAMQRTDRPVATVSVTLKDGRSLSASTRVVRGDAENPVPRETLVGKFLSLAEPAVGAARAREIVDAAARAETLKDITELTSLARR